MEDALVSGVFAVEAQLASDEARLAEAAKTDPQAFGELYERYYVRVYRYVYHRLGNAADAEDISALVFMKALEALPSYQSKRNSFAPWLFRITRNAVVDHYRRQRKQVNLDGIERESPEGNPVSEALNSEKRDEIQVLVKHLSPEQREVVLMRYAADLSFAEIAATMKKNEAAVRMLLHRGLRKMKAVLGDE